MRPKTPPVRLAVRFLACCGLLVPALPALARPLPDGLYAGLDTTKGEIVLRLEFEKTPMTVANFVGLAEGTIANKALPAGVHYFDGTVFDRVVPGHVIQAGKPAGTGLEGPGYEIPNEIAPGLGHGRAGMLGMANSGPHTAGSQFYVTLGDRSYLDGDYTVFGEVVSGLDVVERIVQGDAVRTVTILRVGDEAERFKTDDASFRKLVEAQRFRVAKLEEEKKAAEAKLIKERWPGAVWLKPGLASEVLREGQGSPAAAGRRIIVSYTGETLQGRRFVSGPEGLPGSGEAAQPFPFVPGSTSIVPGLDSVLGLMVPGEKRRVIVRPELGYGPSGFYSRPEPGKKRFVISPDTTLVFEVEVVRREESDAVRCAPPSVRPRKRPRFMLELP
jgi:cyclophilin family peptidyl-prolyl cis-trans isomerase